MQKSSPTQYFWYRVTLDVSSSIEDPAPFNLKIAVCLVIAWVLCYLCMIKGIASSGKVRNHGSRMRQLHVVNLILSWRSDADISILQVVYVTATFPYFVLLIFFFRGITLEGMSDGLIHLFKPDVSSTNLVKMRTGSLGTSESGRFRFRGHQNIF